MRDVGIDYPPGAEGGKLWSMRHVAGLMPATLIVSSLERYGVFQMAV